MGEKSTYNDVCVDNVTLGEAFCNTDGFIAYMTPKCENKCVNGACIK